MIAIRLLKGEFCFMKKIQIHDETWCLYFKELPRNNIYVHMFLYRKLKMCNNIKTNRKFGFLIIMSNILRCSGFSSTVCVCVY